MTKENKSQDESQERRLPLLKKGMMIKYNNYGEGEVLADEAIGSCIVKFNGKGRNTGVRDIHMGLGHNLIEILDEESP